MRGGPVGPRQRRNHKKSRNGCENCKKLHYKCDEGKPSCGGCTKRKVECSFTTSQSPASDVSANTRVFNAISHNITSHNGDTVTPLPMADLELLNQAITSTQYSITPDSKPDKELSGLPFRFPYLMHSTLALAALHLYSEQPHRPELLSRAAAHQHAALSQVRPHIIDVTAEHSQAILNFAAITSIFALAEPAYDPRGLGSARDPVDELLNSFHLGRGIKTILTQAWSLLQHKENIKKVIGLPDYTALKATLDDTYPVYPTLRSVIKESCQDDEAVSCLEALELVFFYMAVNETHQQDIPGPMYVQMWPIDVSTHFLSMLADRNPIALLVLAYYAALMRLRSNTWWLERWPSAILQHVTSTLDPTLVIHLDWPRQKILQLDQAFPFPVELDVT
ncbi:hypothetical protein KCU81_g3428, partial [Aureobasidium melanogenum]|uniref:Zn(2)-C6 fungal-type domain-containing protein n=1 Tax=Aureobasidium melanogenum (strain CBS 110374) TaxID=1043003 RepID=A0A074WGV9_AURM1